MAEAKTRWKTYTKKVLTADSLKSYRKGEAWSVYGGFPVVESPDGDVIHFEKIDGKHIVGVLGFPKTTAWGSPATNPSNKPFRSAKEVFAGKKKIPIEKYEAWLKTHGTKQDITGFAKAKQVAMNAGNPVKTVSLINIHPGLPGRTHLVKYGSSPEEWYHPPKGSAKAAHLKQVGAEVYKHKWKKRVPMYIDPQSGTIIKKLRSGQKADDWLRG